MAVKAHTVQDKEIFQVKGKARHKQKSLQFKTTDFRSSSTMLQCTELPTAAYKLWKQKPPSPKAAIKPWSTDPSSNVYDLFQLSLF